MVKMMENVENVENGINQIESINLTFNQIIELNRINRFNRIESTPNLTDDITIGRITSLHVLISKIKRSQSAEELYHSYAYLFQSLLNLPLSSIWIIIRCYGDTIHSCQSTQYNLLLTNCSTATKYTPKHRSSTLNCNKTNDQT